MAQFDEWKQKAKEAADMAGFYAGEIYSAANTKVFVAQKKLERKKLIAQAGETVYGAFAENKDLPDELFDILRKVQTLGREIEEAEKP